VSSKAKTASILIVLILASAAGFFGFRWQEKVEFEEDVANFSKIAQNVSDPSACAVFHGADFRSHCEDAAVSNSAFESKNPENCASVKDAKFRTACVKAVSATIGSSASSVEACSILQGENKDLCVDAFDMYAGLQKKDYDCAPLVTDTMKARCKTLLSNAKSV